MLPVMKTFFDDSGDSSLPLMVQHALRVKDLAALVVDGCFESTGWSVK